MLQLFIGAGPIGLLFTCFFKASGAAKIIVSEPSDYRRNLAVKCGATRVCDPKKEDLEKIVYKIGKNGHPKLFLRTPNIETADSSY